MLRALLLLACTAKVAAFAQAPAGEPGCVDMDPDVIQSAFAEAIQDVEVEGVPTITSCADVAANGGCADEEVAASCCATCALPQRMTYGTNYYGVCFTEKIICLIFRRGTCDTIWCWCLQNAYWNRYGFDIDKWFDFHKCLETHLLASRPDF